MSAQPRIRQHEGEAACRVSTESTALKLQWNPTVKAMAISEITGLL